MYKELTSQVLVEASTINLNYQFTIPLNSKSQIK